MLSSVKIIAILMALTTFVLPNQYTFLSNTSSPEEMQRIFDVYTLDNIDDAEQVISDIQHLMKIKAADDVSDTYIHYVAAAMQWCADYMVFTRQTIETHTKVTNTLLDSLIEYRIQRCS